MDLFMKTMLLVFPYDMSQKICDQHQRWNKMLYLTTKQTPVHYKYTKYVPLKNRKNYKLLK